MMIISHYEMIQSSKETLNSKSSLNNLVFFSPSENKAKDEDGFVLRMALKQSKIDLKNVKKLIQNLHVENDRCEPKKNFDKLKSKIQRLDEINVQLKQEFTTQIKEFKTLEKQVGKQLDKNDALYEQCRKKEERVTPRPNWNKCTKYIAGGTKRWIQLTYSLSSVDTLDLLLSEFAGMSRCDDVPYEFEGLGTSDSIPVYLRTTGTFRNYKLNRRDVLVMVRDVFSAKAIHDNSTYLKNAKRVHLKDFLLIYFTRRFDSEQKAYEWSYNLMDGLKRFSYEYYPRLLKSILEGHVDEDVYHYFISYTHDLFQYLTNYVIESKSKDLISLGERLSSQKSKEDIKRKRFFINGATFEEALNKKFKSKVSSEINELTNAARLDMENDFVKRNEFSRKTRDEALGEYDLRILFEEDDEGNVGEFLSVLRQQLEKHRLRYADKICYTCVTLHTVKKEEETSEETTRGSRINQLSRSKKPQKSLKEIPKEEPSETSLKYTDFADNFKHEDLMDTSKETGPRLSEDISIGKNEFQKAIRQVDEHITDKEIRRYIDWVFKANKDESALNQLSLLTLKSRLQNLNCYMHETVDNK